MLRRQARWAGWLALTAAALQCPVQWAAATPRYPSCPDFPGPQSIVQPVPNDARSRMLDSLERAASPVSGLGAASAGDENWTPINLVGYSAASLIVDSRRDRLIAYAGENGSTQFSGSAWTRPLSDEGAWTLIDAQGPGPVGRMDHAAVYDPVRDRMLVYAGWSYEPVSASAVWALELSGTPRWSQLTPAGSGPGYRVGTHAAYDPAGDRMIVFGGHAVDRVAEDSSLWALNLSGTPSWEKLSPTGVIPPPREDGVLFPDPRRHRMILFGGCPGYFGLGALNDVWELSLGDSVAWRRLTPGGEIVPGRREFAAAYDPVGDQLLVFSGRDSSRNDPPQPEAWALRFRDSLAWVRIVAPDPVPGPRYFSRATFDSSRNRMVLFGGAGAGDETWVLSLADGPAWTRLEAGDPDPAVARYLLSAVCDSSRRRILVYGGESMYTRTIEYEYTTYADLWSLSLEPHPRWERLARDSAPAARHGHSAVIDPVGDRMIVFGGSGYPGPPTVAGLWQLPLAPGQPWSLLGADGMPPDDRYLHSAIYDSRRHRMIIHGGVSAAGIRDDTWALELEGRPSWTRLAPLGDWPSARWGHSAVYDPVGDRMIVFGGSTATSATNETWQLTFDPEPRWSPFASAELPSPRRMAAMVYDALRQRVVMFGGQAANTGSLADTWILPLGDSTGWRPATYSAGIPNARWGAAAVYDDRKDRVVLLGGARNACGDGMLSPWTMTSAVPVVTALTLAAVESHPWHVVLTWRAPIGSEFAAAVERRTASTDWTYVATLHPDASGTLRFEDETAQPASQYAYRLAWTTAGTAYTSSETWVTVPPLRLALVGAAPNPSPRGLAIAFSLPDAAPARLEVFDLFGRRVAARDVGTLGAGDHVLGLDASKSLRSGIYLIRLQRGSTSLTTRACVIR